MKLTPYDEFPVHQAPHPFSYVPSTDYNWDDGYYWGVFDPAIGVVLAMGLRVNPNTDMIGGYDLLYTLCAAADVTPPARNLCGRSYLPLVQGRSFPKKNPWRTIIYGSFSGAGAGSERSR